MLRGELQIELAMLRMQLRAIEGEVNAVRRESQRYRQMHFGLDIKEIQLTALMDQRDACLRQISELRIQLDLREVRRDNPLAWLLVPVALWGNLQKTMAPRSQQNGSVRTPRVASSIESVAVGAGY